MCGIIGAICTRPVIKRDRFECACDSMNHRGPDDRGFYFKTPRQVSETLWVALGHRRLSIIDLDTGHQPIGNEEGSVHVVCNGEIYNFKELKEGLLKRGHTFSTRSDTEVIVHLYEEKGIELLHDLRGMFAFALYDEKEDTLFFARDRIGKKPLVYTVRSDGFFFASEILPLLKLCDTERRLDLRAMDLYLSLQYIPAPFTAFKGLKKLPPAHYGVVKKGRLECVRRYWDVDFKDKIKIDYDEARERCREEFIESVRLRMISDVPLGAFLSGGVDSSITVGVMSMLSSQPVKTFTIGFEERGFNEIPFAREIARRFNTEHHEYMVKPAALDVLPELIKRFGEPFADQSIIPTYYVSKYTSKEVKVALSGDGGDENFGGYKRYYHIMKSQWLQKWGLAGLWILLRKASLSLEKIFNKRRRHLVFPLGPQDEIFGLEAIDGYIRLLEFVGRREKFAIFRGEARDLLEEDSVREYLEYISGSFKGGEELERFLYIDMKSYLPEDILYKVDITGMANSLECRNPFLDHKFVEFIASLPASYKFRLPRDTKRIIKDAFSHMIPPSFFDREKKGFSMPLKEWIRDELYEPMREIMMDGRSDIWEILEKGHVESMLNEHRNGLRDNSKGIWAIFILAYWMTLLRVNV